MINILSLINRGHHYRVSSSSFSSRRAYSDAPVLLDSNVNAKFVYITGNDNIVAKLDQCNPNFVVDLTDPNSTLSTVIHTIEYKNVFYRMRVNRTNAIVDKYWLAGFVFGDGC